ncbi:hypothetical protein L1987_70972 [Smallanthus sonchifolius]|uniref:Uncharacterized protein n=1 Tax=Smallanthus sonchifolius TaxID=185202 RepID=A0ACB9AR31_9ASTR|nr:hypothetical protein L1987_70972 [Smallanthus sonchifolius]
MPKPHQRSINALILVQILEPPLAPVDIQKHSGVDCVDEIGGGDGDFGVRREAVAELAKMETNLREDGE